MIGLVFGLLEQGLKLWNAKEAHKYLDELIQLRKEWNEEYNKPRAYRDDAELDGLTERLHILSSVFLNSSREKND